MKKSLFISVVIFGSINLQGQDCERIAMALNYPPLFKLITFGNSFNQNRTIYQTYKRLSTQGQCWLEIRRGLKKFKIKLDTSGYYKSKNEKYGQEAKIFRDSQNRIVKTWDKHFVEEYIYDKEYRLIEINAYFENFNLDSKTLSTYKWSQPDGWKGKYDERGNLIEEITTWTDKPNFTTTYEFVNNKIMTSTSTNHSNTAGAFERHVYSYEGDILTRIDAFNEKGKKMYSIDYVWRFK